MALSRKLLKEFEKKQRWLFPEELVLYLLDTYSEEGYPYPLDEESLFHNIKKDVLSYEVGKLDTRIPSRIEKLESEIKWIKELYEEAKRSLFDSRNHSIELEELLVANKIPLPPNGEIPF